MAINTRWLAARAITRILQNGVSLTYALEEVLPKHALSPKDQALVKAMCYGVCRYYHRLDHIIGLLIEKPIKTPEVKALIMIGLYQLIYMRVKPHAAVSETVQAAGKKTSWARGLINAVLRNFLRNQAKYQDDADNLQTAKFSHPEWLINRINQDWPAQAEAIFWANNQPPPLTLRINVNKISRDDYVNKLLEQNLAAHVVTHSPQAITLENPTAVELLPGFTQGWFSVQDTAAQLAAALLDVKPGHRVLDVCAAPGGKTAHILELEPGLKELVAIDIDTHRLQRIKQNLERLNLNATVLAGDAAKPQAWWDGKPFDRILLDAPCSATGVIRRHPDIKLLRRPEDIQATCDLQKQILYAVWPLLTLGGKLVYVTCSVLKQENASQIQDFLSNHDDAVELPIDSVTWGTPEPCGRQILTGEASMDGFYYACLAKR